jgi:tRNA-specific adenosine deaminase 1
VSSTGLKCLPSTKVPQANGNVLHDCHAEIVAIRAFNCYLVKECLLLTQGLKVQSDVIELNGSHSNSSARYKLKEGIKIHMYSSEAPCGDASMELVMNSQEDATPWENPPTDMPGRGGFSQLGVVRRKPGKQAP